jgi:hypothetical protein
MLNRHFALAYFSGMIFSPAEASLETANTSEGFARAGNRFPLFGIML